MSSEGDGKSNLFSAYKVSTADFEDFLYFLKLITFGLFINDLSKSNWSFLCFAMDRVSSCIFPWEFELFCVNQGQNLKMSVGLPTKIYSRSSYQDPTSQTKTVCTELVLFGHMWWHIYDVIQLMFWTWEKLDSIPEKDCCQWWELVCQNHHQVWLWWWHLPKLLKCKSPSLTKVALRTSPTWTIRPQNQTDNVIVCLSNRMCRKKIHLPPKERVPSQLFMAANQVACSVLLLEEIQCYYNTFVYF